MDAIYAKIYANLVFNNLKTIDEVPEHLKEQVTELLK